MFIRLFLLFTIVPLVELWLLLRVGELIGALNTLLLVIGTGVAGATLARQQGLALLRTFQSSMAAGQMPHDPMIDGMLILLGGAMLITPGVATDALGLALVIPFTRVPLRKILVKVMADKIKAGSAMGGMGGGGFTYTSSATPFPPPGEGAPKPRQGRHVPTPPKDDDVIDV